jgi:ABC-type multidrug transport system ATPase subunit
MDTTNPFIEVNNLRRSFKDIEAVAGISFSVQRGEILGLLGLNGAGKTITIRLLTGQKVSATS